MAMKTISMVIILVACSTWLSDGHQITQNQTEIVRGIRTELSGNPEGHGAVMFARLVTEYPEIGQIFPFGNEGLTYDELLLDDRVRAHGKLVMQTLAQAVDILDDADALVPILQNLAMMHTEYTVSKENYQYVGDAFLYAVEEGIGHELNEEAEAALVTFFQFLVDTMFDNLPDNDPSTMAQPE